MNKVLYGNLATTIGRSIIGLLFAFAGFNKIINFEGTADYMAQAGLPLAQVLLVLTILLEFVGGIMLVIGYKTRLVGFLFAGFTLLASLIFHIGEGQMMLFIKNMMILSGLLYISAYGSGKISLDAKLACKKN